ncbi:hypothetical protein J2S77_001745 [Alkalibacillus salilacus]|uniref:Uncharacterized protein n=1 Tax=Alkalibacillus salilacus TaxID=284582 RepID=A0ABT9VFL0_9BACI|nr:hypothetical protein [Alkalibacillus salilacus]
MMASIVLGIVGIKSNEKGFLKYTGILIVALLIIGLALTPVLMGLFGFREP